MSPLSPDLNTVVGGRGILVRIVITARDQGTGKMIVLDTMYCEEVCTIEELVGLYG